ncbi:MAG: hypothetical protein ACRD9L_00530, partial [Bryobacteraceae bacterium]
MKITALRYHSVAVADPPLRSSYGRHAPYALRTIIELDSTDGLTGISETYGGDAQIAALEAARHYVVGMDPFRLTGLYTALTQKEPAAADVAGGRTQMYLVPGENPLDQPSST